MYAITGATGHVGGAAARSLRLAGAPVRVVVRSPERAAVVSDLDAEIAIADFTDSAALARAFAGCAGAFVMLPTIATGSDATHRGMADAIVSAVADSGVPHVVTLSSMGADLPDGTGPIRWLHHLEQGLRTTDARVSVLRPPHFQEKVETVLGAVMGAGLYPVLADSADVPTPMVATVDIGALAAELLLAPPARSEVIDLDPPSYTERDVAAALADVLGTPVEVVTVPRDGWLDALTGGGVPQSLAQELCALYEAEQQGLLRPIGDRSIRCTTPLIETLREVIDTASTTQLS